MGIIKDFESGDKGELLVNEHLEKLGYTCEKNKDKETRQHYDLLILELNKTLEVKNDLYAVKSGNIAIEYNNCKSDKPSGLGITRADVWCHIIDNKPYVVTVKKLKTFVKENTPKRIVTQAGDGNADLYLYSVEDAMKVFIPIERIGEIL